MPFANHSDMYPIAERTTHQESDPRSQLACSEYSSQLTQLTTKGERGLCMASGRDGIRRELPILVLLLLLAGKAVADDGIVVLPPGTKPPVSAGPKQPGTPVYPKDTCTGPVVNGVCQGGVIPRDAWQKRCYGEMINGECTGPMF
jgi:hypothetical protein